MNEQTHSQCAVCCIDVNPAVRHCEARHGTARRVGWDERRAASPDPDLAARLTEQLLADDASRRRKQTTPDEETTSTDLSLTFYAR